MKKILTSVMCITAAALVLGCTSKKIDTPKLPSHDKVTGIELSTSKDKNGILIKPGSVTKDIMNIIKDTLKKEKDRGEESTNETPVNTDKFFTVSIYSNADKAAIFHFYEKGGKKYMEKPYGGIWDISDEYYNKIMKITE
ncbi:MAG: DUF5301 domain-containing protein [Hornefia sp.]|nr:DUF5301 domain-containing protein [Hornefia sp.]